MRSNRFFLLGPLVLVAVIISGCIGDTFCEFGDYYRDIERYYDTDEEKQAIDHAENEINYTKYTNLTRWENEWANFIDTEVIDHYNGSFTTDRDAGREADVYFVYNAWARFFTQLSFKMRNNRYSLEIKLNNEMYLEGFEDPPYLELDIEEMVIVHLEKGSWVFDKERWDTHYWDEDFDVELHLNFTNVYFVLMHLTYDDIWGPLAGVFVDTAQFLILDENYNPLMIGVVPSSWMVS